MSMLCVPFGCTSERCERPRNQRSPVQVLAYLNGMQPVLMLSARYQRVVRLWKPPLKTVNASPVTLHTDASFLRISHTTSLCKSNFGCSFSMATHSKKCLFLKRNSGVFPPGQHLAALQTRHHVTESHHVSTLYTHRAIESNKTPKHTLTLVSQFFYFGI